MSGDAYYDKVVLLLPMSGANNGTTFTDYSPSPKTITRYNAVTSTAQSKYYGSSGYFDGTGDYLTIPNTADIRPGATDFTAELWVYRTAAVAYATIIGQAKYGDYLNGEWAIILSGDGTNLRATWIVSNTDQMTQTWNVTVPLNSWAHIAFCKSGNDARVFMDGEQVGTTKTVSTLTDPGVSLGIGRPMASTGIYPYFTGYLQDVRITKGIARYTSAFTPPTRMTGNSISGTVVDDDGDPVARSIFAVPRLAPATYTRTATSDSGDGTYTLTELVDTPHFVACLDDDAGTDYNALVFDRVTPA